MATRSTIAFNGKKIYCHWDGYPSHNGAILKKHYTNPEKIEQLMELGSLSSLGAEIGEKHNFENCPAGQCNAYHRDRGEELTTFWNQEEEYNYEFVNGEWLVDGNPF